MHISEHHITVAYLDKTVPRVQAQIWVIFELQKNFENIFFISFSPNFAPS